MLGRALLLLGILQSLLPPAAAAHEFWLAPSSYRAAAGDTVAIAAFVGTGFRGERKPYATTRALRFELNGPRTLDLRPAGMNGDLTFARFVAADGGGCLVAYESDFVPIELGAAEFDRYLALEGLDGPLKARAKLGAGPGRERYARCPKTWISGRETSRLTRPAGLTLELVPANDPTAGPSLRVQLLYRGRPLAGALVRSWNRPLNRSVVPADAAARDSVGPQGGVRTDRQGFATLAVDRPGEWLVSAVHMVPSADRSAADWQSFWASLTFARTPPP